MKNQNNSLKTNGFISKVKLWFYNIFHKSQASENKLNNSNSLNTEKNNVLQKSFFEEYKEKNDRRQYLLVLQKKYKNKEILEKDMNEQDRIDLENLYVEQNTELKRKIRGMETKITKATK